MGSLAHRRGATPCDSTRTAGTFDHMCPDQDVTRLLGELRNARSDAVVDELLPLVYDELRRVARARLRGEREGHTLNATALVHEAYLKLVDQRETDWKNRAHFFAVASRAMRRILIDYANMRNAQKRGGGEAVVTLADGDAAYSARTDDLLALDEALRTLETLDPRQAQVVQLRFFGGLRSQEIAEVLDVSLATVNRDWRSARAWLTTRLRT
jgi:RNA polymerase sigma factor (TIGR02999 family)